YCLLVFGPEAKTRVWLVQDDDTLYVDRNGNGDLSEPAKRVSGNRHHLSQAEYSFDAGDVPDGPLVHKRLTVSAFSLQPAGQSQTARRHQISIDVEMLGWQGDGIEGRVHQRAFQDIGGVLQFADTPEAAPIVHFGGPWQVMLSGEQQLTAGQESSFFLHV